MVGGMLEVAGRVVASLVFAKHFGFAGICASNPTAWVFVDIFLVIAYVVILHAPRRPTSPSRPPPLKIDVPSNHCLLIGYGV